MHVFVLLMFVPVTEQGSPFRTRSSTTVRFRTPARARLMLEPESSGEAGQKPDRQPVEPVGVMSEPESGRAEAGQKPDRQPVEPVGVMSEPESGRARWARNPPCNRSSRFDQYQNPSRVGRGGPETRQATGRAGSANA
jgi:hypothetical protein